MKEKRSLPPDTLLYPCPAVLVSAAFEGRRSIITLAWAGVACSEPPMVSVAMRPSRFTHGLVTGSGEFVVNVPSASQVREVDLCGTVSGRKIDKFRAFGFTAAEAEMVSAPLIAECPVNLECRVRHTIRLGSHDLFVAEVLRVHAEAGTVSPEGTVSPRDPLVYVPGARVYRAAGPALGAHGFSRRRERA